MSLINWEARYRELEKTATAEHKENERLRELLARAYAAGHRKGWEDGETNAEVFAAINDELGDWLRNRIKGGEAS